MLQPAVTQQYPHVKPDLPARTPRRDRAQGGQLHRLLQVLARVPRLVHLHRRAQGDARPGGRRARALAKVLDRFAIDYALCMYCGICVEVCPFDALFWSPEFEYGEYDIDLMTHEKERLEEWTYTVLPPPALEEGAEPTEEQAS